MIYQFCLRSAQRGSEAYSTSDNDSLPALLSSARFGEMAA